MAKVIANRFRIVMDKCIDLTQSAFVPGRLICYNILLAYELQHNFKHKRARKKGFMAVKLDMSKAYDRVEWNFVEEVMKKFGFDWEWVASLIKCVQIVLYSEVLNGYIGETFFPCRGLRQGDPLSPFLFLFCGEGLSSLMRLTMQGKTIRVIKASKIGPHISHLLFADDCILFDEATERVANSLKQILQEYEICSGQSVNYSKSTIFFSINMQEEIKRIIIRVLGDRLQQRIDNWSIKYLSQGGNELEVLVFEDKFNIALLAKQCWRLINYPNSLLARVLKAEYYSNSNFLNAPLGNLPSLTWKSVWSAKGLLEKNLCWRVGKGDRISVWTDLWVSGNEEDKIQNQSSNENIELVSDLIDEENRTWKTELIVNTFHPDIARKIM
ncbi:reverse transcriptase [Gossypium australe]|uniref:Reverse transcriptase n=1 Tax=Gossypium australe TaxID=47621 RepID=A0A5B6W6P9_9ROSI|nr:reverse transcriptase [Gossypium australe]